MVDKAQFVAQFVQFFEALVVKHAVRHCRGEEVGPFY